MTSGNIYYFNPTCELAVANGSFSYLPPLLLQEMERDLAILPFVFCSENDFVITEKKPSEKFILNLKNLGFNMPSFCSISELETMPNGSFHSIIPWGWSPATHYKLSRLKEKCSPEFKESPVYNWQEVHKTLYERATSLSFLHKITDLYTTDYLIPKELTGTKVYCIAEIEMLLGQHQQLVIKAPLSSSGRGIQMIRKPELDRARKQWIAGVLKQQNYLIAEPFLKKRIDFSFQLKIMSKKEIHFQGISFFETNSNGQYQGTLLNAKPELFNTFDSFNLNEKLQYVSEIIHNELINSIYPQYYRGYIGIDAMIFECGNKFFIHPCVEVNCRMNMGILAKLLENKIAAEKNGKFELFYDSNERFVPFINREKAANQLIINNYEILSGTVPLTEGINNTKYGAYISVF